MNRVLRMVKSRLQRRRSSRLMTRSMSLSTSHRLSSSWSFEAEDEESDEEMLFFRCSSPPQDVPEGCLAVYVGREEQRFVVDAKHLNHPWFKILLRKSAEEFGYTHKHGRLLLPCEAVLFDHLLWLLEHKMQTSTSEMLEIEELLESYS